jgi:hypothetical protein
MLTFLCLPQFWHFPHHNRQHANCIEPSGTRHTTQMSTTNSEHTPVSNQRYESCVQTWTWFVRCPGHTTWSESVTLRLTVTQSVYLGVEPTLWAFDQILLRFQVFGSEICCPVFVGRPLWREARSVLCKSQSSNVFVCTFTIYSFIFHTFTTYICMYIYIYIYIYVYTV